MLKIRPKIYDEHTGRRESQSIENRKKLNQAMFLFNVSLYSSTLQKSKNENTEGRPFENYERGGRRHEKCEKANPSQVIRKMLI